MPCDSAFWYLPSCHTTHSKLQVSKNLPDNFSATNLGSTSGDKGQRTTPDLLQGHSLHNSAAKLLEQNLRQSGLDNLGLQAQLNGSLGGLDLSAQAHLQTQGLENLLTNLAATPQLGLGNVQTEKNQANQISASAFNLLGQTSPFTSQFNPNAHQRNSSVSFDHVDFQ